MRRPAPSPFPALFSILALLGLLVALPDAAAAQGDDGYVVRDLAPGVFAAVAPEGVASYLFANSLVVIGDDGVLVVDSGQRPALAEELIGLIRERTDRPVRWVVNTHWHGDHVWGNASFLEAFPEARILATPATRDSIAAASRRQIDEQLAQHRLGRERLSSMTDTADAALLARIRAADSVRVDRIAEMESLEVVLPTEVFRERTTLDLGDRTAVLLPLGPAHTPGDAAVWLPEERVLGAGDLLESGELWLEGADVVGWTRALDALAALEPAVIVASHGAISRDGALLAAGREQLRAAVGGSQGVAAQDSTDILYSVTGLDGPEAVRYDPEQDVWFVASFGPSASDTRDGNGYISRVAAEDGRVIEQRFMTGTASSPLHMPRGMFIRDDTLWVADVDGVHGFDRRTGEHAKFVDFTAHEPGFLNDIAMGPDGLLYVTDTSDEAPRVYRIRRDGGVEIAVEDARVGPANGITWDPTRQAFLLAPWVTEDAVLRAWDPATGAFEDVARLPGGRFDGIEVTEAGVVVAGQVRSELLLVGPAGSVRTLISVPGAPADIGMDTRRGRVAVPYIRAGRVDVWGVR